MGKRGGTRPLRARLCLLHGTQCLWAGGDGSMEREVALMVAQLGLRDEEPTDEQVIELAKQRLEGMGSDCHQATRHDQVQSRGIFASPVNAPAIDPSLTALIAQMEAEQTPEERASDAARRARTRAQFDRLVPVLAKESR